MAIPTNKQLEQSEVAAKTYDHEWIRNFAVRSSSLTEGNIYIETVAFDAATSEINNGIKATEIRRDDFWDLVAEVPEAAAAMAAVFDAIPSIQAWVEAKESEALTE